ncbi:hypothetical protein AB833_04045 [Chromatiales bacterium (ex Bugula neritina AB1)]|nr:hypothetical protein AB833_04045 [Chromatiales bacterium (ex Bugula neritina AB1)]
MPVVRKFIRLTSATGLQEYFQHKQIPLPTMDWSREPAQVAAQLIAWVAELSPGDRARLRVDAERITQMADETGQGALLNAVTDAAQLSRMSSAMERSRWIYLHAPDKFRHAEDVRYSDQYRHGRDWSGYQVEASLPLHNDPVSINIFKAKIKALFGLGDKVKVEPFERTLPDEEGKEITAVQLMVYQEGLPDTYLVFEGEENITSRIRHPVFEHAITYASSSGTIEVIAAKRTRRTLIAQAFTEALLKRPTKADKLPLRRYDLQPLMTNQPLDWDAEDGIESVQLVMIKLKDLTGKGHVQIDVPAKNPVTLHDYAQEHFGKQNPMRSTLFAPTQARIRIRFYPHNGVGRGKVLSVKLTLPNGCDLRSRTDKERLIGEKYLRRWGLLEELGQ